MALATQQGQVQAPAASRFRELTRQQMQPLQSQVVNQFGQLFTFPMTTTGYLANIYLYLTGTVTIPATPTGNWQTYPPPPFNLFKRIRVSTSEGVELINVSGWGLAHFLLRQKRLQTISVDPVAYLNTAGRALLFTAPSGALVAGAIPFTGWLKLPIMTDAANMFGLIMLQSQDVRLYVELTTCNALDLVTVGATAPTAIAISVTPTVEFFSIPPTADQPNLNWVHSIQEEQFPLTNIGDTIYRPTLGNVYMSIAGIVENAGAQLAPANINTISLSYAQSVRSYYEPYPNHLARLKDYYGITLPDGSFAMDLTMGGGDPGIDDPRDFLNSSMQTDLQVIVNTSGFTPTNAILRVVKEQLAAIG